MPVYWFFGKIKLTETVPKTHHNRSRNIFLRKNQDGRPTPYLKMELLNFFIVIDLTFSEPKHVLAYEQCLVIHNLMGSQNNFSFVAKLATLGNSHNLHTSKMATRTHLENYLKWCIRCLFIGFHVYRIHFWCYFFQFQVKVMSKSRWLSNAILKIELLNYLT